MLVSVQLPVVPFQVEVKSAALAAWETSRAAAVRRVRCVFMAGGWLRVVMMGRFAGVEFTGFFPGCAVELRKKSFITAFLAGAAMFGARCMMVSSV